MAVDSGKKLIRRHTDLDVYQLSFATAMRIFELTKKFPAEERYSLTDQIRRSSRSVCANLAEAWRKRRYEAAFISKLGDSEAEAAESQTWIQFAKECEYLPRETAKELYTDYDKILSMLVHMITHAKDWTFRQSDSTLHPSNSPSHFLSVIHKREQTPCTSPTTKPSTSPVTPSRAAASCTVSLRPASRPGR